MKPARHESPEPRQDEDKADLQDLLPTERALDIRSVSLTGLFVLATFYSLYLRGILFYRYCWRGF
jgi:hypothetical protein